VTRITSTLLRTNLHYQLPFRRPIFDFSNFGAAFFSMIRDGLVGKYVVNASDFSLRSGNNLGEFQYKYNLFGGAASVTLTAEKLLFDFPNVTPVDGPVIMSVIQTIHDAFPVTFPNLGYDNVEAQAYSHYDVGDVAAVDKLLSRFLLPDVEKRPELGGVIQRPFGRLELTAEDQSWQCSTSIERSLLASTAVFVGSSLIMRKMNENVPFADKIAMGQKITSACLGVLGLELKRADC
jgi:hypothetical protein